MRVCAELSPDPARCWDAVAFPAFLTRSSQAELAPRPPRASPHGQIPCPGSALSLPALPEENPALTAQGSAPRRCRPAAHQAAGDALADEGVPVLLVGAVVHGIPADTRFTRAAEREVRRHGGAATAMPCSHLVPLPGPGPLAGDTQRCPSPRCSWAWARARPASGLARSSNDNPTRARPVPVPGDAACPCGSESRGTRTRVYGLCWKYQKRDQNNQRQHLLALFLILETSEYFCVIGAVGVTLCVISAVALWCSGIITKPGFEA